MQNGLMTGCSGTWEIPAYDNQTNAFAYGTTCQSNILLVNQTYYGKVTIPWRPFAKDVQAQGRRESGLIGQTWR